MWAGGEMPALLMACLPKTRQTTRHFTETDYWYTQWLNLKHVRLSHKQYMKQTDSVNRDCRWIFNKFKRLFTPVNILWKAFHVHNCKLLIFSPSSDLFFPPLGNIQYSLSWEFSVPAYYPTILLLAVWWQAVCWGGALEDQRWSVVCWSSETHRTLAMRRLMLMTLVTGSTAELLDINKTTKSL